ncbi:spore germination protein [Falsibacillus albus]|uniref:Spore germination protein n=1 Tax=Falsibacillus albus TaxID=2478915 RepID=A0A3L7K1C0_9BACI|nr:spore germination protein [Falsibacillus albus]RLQ96179.1 spore germination protein [Falsibacillus albus]
MKKLCFQINVGSIIVDNISNNANINFGPTYQNSHTANSIIIGSCISIGDCVWNRNKILNGDIRVLKK